MDDAVVETILFRFRMMVVEEDLCPDCLGHLDDDLICTKCRYDAWEEFEHAPCE